MEIQSKNLRIVLTCILLSVLLWGCGNTNSLPTSGIERIFGANLDEAGEIFHIDFTKLEPEEQSDGNLHYQIYTPDEIFLLGEEKVRVSFYFLMNEYEGAAIGLDTVRMIFGEEADGYRIAEYITDTYGLDKPSIQTAKEDETQVTKAFWTEQILGGEEALYQNVSAAYETIFGVSMTKAFWSMEMSVGRDGTLSFYATGRPWALMRHMGIEIEDSNLTMALIEAVPIKMLKTQN